MLAYHAGDFAQGSAANVDLDLGSTVSTGRRGSRFRSLNERRATAFPRSPPDRRREISALSGRATRTAIRGAGTRFTGGRRTAGRPGARPCSSPIARPARLTRICAGYRVSLWRLPQSFGRWRGRQSRDLGRRRQLRWSWRVVVHARRRPLGSLAGSRHDAGTS